MTCAASCATAGARRTSRPPGLELHEGDVLDPSTLKGAGDGVDVAYYLVHSMGRGGGHDSFAERERQGATSFARMAHEEGVQRVVYLGGLGEPRSEHLKSRAETARVLASEGPAAHLLPRGNGDRREERVLQDAPLPGGAPAGDDRSRLAA